MDLFNQVNQLLTTLVMYQLSHCSNLMKSSRTSSNDGDPENTIESTFELTIINFEITAGAERRCVAKSTPLSTVLNL